MKFISSRTEEVFFKWSIFSTPSSLSLFKVLEKLMMLIAKNRVLLNSVQEFTEIEALLLLTFFVCLRDQLSSVHSIVTY